MTEQSRRPSPDRSTPRLGRRRLLTLGSGATVALLAGCSGSPGGSDGGGGYGGGAGGNTATQGEGETGTFRLLISDQPVAIDEFDSLDVTLERARIFPGAGDEDDDEGDDEDTDTATDEGEGATDDGTTSPTATESTPTAQATEDDDDEEPEEDGDDAADDEEGPPESDDEGAEDRGFRILELGGVTVDLTEVVGDRAISVFEGGLPAGEYRKIELESAAVEGVVDGEPVDVKLPSEKLQITKPFEIAPGGTLSFVFDITVVRKGNGGYNLLPVIGESGVVGRDVEVEEVGRGDDADDGDDDEQDDDTETATEGGDGGPPEDSGPPTQTEV